MLIQGGAVVYRAARTRIKTKKSSEGARFLFLKILLIGMLASQNEIFYVIFILFIFCCFNLVEESKSVMRKLQSPTLAMPAKRHLMHVVFGDYRKFMKQQQQKNAPSASSASKSRSSKPKGGAATSAAIEIVAPSSEVHDAKKVADIPPVVQETKLE